ncbi:hypothetical protein [Metabacillus sp. RGM 3146]|uniref:hypothetical protein n=1 Tax=Metabacillus sp. RGM 3146 TaxID=3401092 RepID=UPI003B9C15B3
MAKKLHSSLKWLIFTFATMLLAYFFTGLSVLTASFFITGFLFTVGYLNKEGIHLNG